MTVDPFLSFFSTVRPREQCNGVCTLRDNDSFRGPFSRGKGDVELANQLEA